MAVKPHLETIADVSADWAVAPPGFIEVTWSLFSQCSASDAIIDVDGLNVARSGTVSVNYTLSRSPTPRIAVSLAAGPRRW